MNGMRIAPLLVPLVLLLAAISPVSAGSPSALPPSSVLVLPVSPNLPPSLPARDLPEAFLKRTLEQQSRLLPVLKALAAKGHLANFELIRDANAFRVNSPDAQALVLLRQHPGVRVVPATPETLAQARQALSKTMSELFRRMDETRRAESKKPRTTTAGFSSIFVEETWDWVSGYYGSVGGIIVTAVLSDSKGNIKSVTSATTDNSGYFYAYFWNGGNGDIEATD